MSTEFSEDEFKIAYSISEHPELVCIDVLELYGAVSDWDMKTLVELDDYNNLTLRADLFYVFLCTADERKRFNRNFRFRKAFQVFSNMADILPTSDMFVVKKFPLTENDLILVAARYLMNTEYAEKQRKFLFGAKLCDMDSLLGG